MPMQQPSLAHHHYSCITLATGGLALNSSGLLLNVVVVRVVKVVPLPNVAVPKSCSCKAFFNPTSYLTIEIFFNNMMTVRHMNQLLVLHET